MKIPAEMFIVAPPTFEMLIFRSSPPLLPQKEMARVIWLSNVTSSTKGAEPAPTEMPIP